MSCPTVHPFPMSKSILTIHSHSGVLPTEPGREDVRGDDDYNESSGGKNKESTMGKLMDKLKR